MRSRPTTPASWARQITGNQKVGGRPNQPNPLRHPAITVPIGCNDVRFEDFTTDQQGLMWSCPFRNRRLRGIGESEGAARQGDVAAIGRRSSKLLEKAAAAGQVSAL
jgi:hypothetical protein